eukprot:204655-Pyramimonas_sp.AAC.1
MLSSSVMWKSWHVSFLPKYFALCVASKISTITFDVNGLDNSALSPGDVGEYFRPVWVQLETALCRVELEVAQ